jgi:hypothetical protein
MPLSADGVQALPRLVQQHARLMRANTLDALIEKARQSESRAPLQWRHWVTEQLQHYGFAELAQVLDKSTMLLSAVQQRAVAILREAWAKPAVLMVDEPTADLEGYEAFLLLDLIKQIGQQQCAARHAPSAACPGCCPADAVARRWSYSGSRSNGGVHSAAAQCRRSAIPAYRQLRCPHAGYPFE